MSAAEGLLDGLDSCGNSPEWTELLTLASFFLRLASALLLQKASRLCPKVLDILIARDQSRIAGRRSLRLREQSGFMRRKALQ